MEKNLFLMTSANRDKLGKKLPRCSLGDESELLRGGKKRIRLRESQTKKRGGVGLTT